MTDVITSRPGSHQYVFPPAGHPCGHIHELGINWSYVAGTAAATSPLSDLTSQQLLVPCTGSSLDPGLLAAARASGLFSTAAGLTEVQGQQCEVWDVLPHAQRLAASSACKFSKGLQLLQQLPVAATPAAAGPAAPVLATARVDLAGALTAPATTELSLQAAAVMLSSASTTATPQQTTTADAEATAAAAHPAAAPAAAVLRASLAADAASSAMPEAAQAVPLLGPRGRPAGQVKVSARFHRPCSALLQLQEELAAAQEAAAAAQHACTTAQQAAGELQSQLEEQQAAAAAVAAKLAAAEVAAGKWAAVEQLAGAAEAHDLLLALLANVNGVVQQLLLQCVAFGAASCSGGSSDVLGWSLMQGELQMPDNHCTPLRTIASAHPLSAVCICVPSLIANCCTKAMPGQKVTPVPSQTGSIMPTQQ